MKLFITFIVVLFFNPALSQYKIDSTISINDMGRNGKESVFRIKSGHNEYLVKFRNSGISNDSLVVLYEPQNLCILKTKIEVLDTLELEGILYKGKRAILIKTGGNILIKHMLRLTKRKAKLFQLNQINDN